MVLCDVVSGFTPIGCSAGLLLDWITFGLLLYFNASQATEVACTCTWLLPHADCMRAVLSVLEILA